MSGEQTNATKQTKGVTPVVKIAHTPPEPARKIRLKSRWAWSVGLTALVAVGATVAAVMGKKTGIELVFAVITLAALTWPYMAYLTTSFRHDVQGWLNRRPGPGMIALVAALLVSYVFYALGCGVFEWLALARITVFAGVPAALIYSAGKKPAGAWQDLATVACIWLPFNFGLLNSIWVWPEGEAAYILNTPLAIDLALVLFLGYRRFDQLQFRFRVNAKELKLVALMTVGFMALALPIGFATGFLGWNPRLTPDKLIGTPLGIFFFIAIPEELLFRGLLQNMLIARFGRPAVALVITSLCFGVSHWHNPGLPDFRYMALAAVAGLFYGFTYMRSRSIVVPALLHTCVDTLWELFFHM